MEIAPETKAPSTGDTGWLRDVQYIRAIADSLRKAQQSLGKNAKNALQASEVLDLPALRRHLAASKAPVTAYLEHMKALEDAVSRFNLTDIPEHDYAQVFEAACARLDLRVEGSFPSYEVFPFEIRISLAEEQVLLNNRVNRALDPVALASTIRRELDRLMRSRLNEGQFMSALLRAYDLLVSESVQTKGRPMRQVRLKRIYQVLTLLKGRSGYSERLFAFDLYRLRDSSNLVWNNRRLIFGNVRSATNALAVPSHTGTKYLGYLEAQEVDEK
jgi:hypothetical protein